jgi:exodeoxyribonuclease VII small subunit
MSKSSKLKSFEKSLEELEEIVNDLEAGEVGLDESLKKFEKGVSIYKDCKKLLGDAEKKIKILTENLKEEDFE